MNWDNIIEGRVVILGNFNTHRTEWKLHFGERMEVAGLETLSERHDLILNNELVVATRLTRNSRTSIIELTVTTPDIRALDACVINEELSKPSNHEVVLCNLQNLDETVGELGTSQEVKDWNIKTLSEYNRN